MATSVRRRIIRLIAMFAVVTGASIATATAVSAYPTPPASAHETAGCTVVQQGQTCVFTFQFVDSNGNGVTGDTVNFSESGVPGSSVSPTTGVTDPGFVSTTFTASATNTGTAVITAASGNVSASASTSVVSSGIQGAGATLPNTSPTPPGPSALLYLGLGLAVMIILGGAITLRRSRSTVS
jgi:hypothetical protein